MIPRITYCCRRILIPKCPPSLHKILVLVSLDGWDFQKKILMSVCSRCAKKANEFLFECRRRQVCQGILQASPAAPVRDRSFKGVMSTLNATSAGPRRGSPRLRPSSLGERESGTAAGRGRRLPRSLKGIYPPRAPLEWAGTQSCPNLAPST